MNLIKKFHKHLGHGVKMYFLKEPTDDYSGIAISSGDEEAIDKIVRACNAHDDLIDFVQGVAKCELGANGQFNFVIESARELLAKARGEV